MAQYLTIATNAENNDIYMDGLNDLAMSEDKYALANIVKNRQLTVTGELQYNLDAGIPYFATVFASPADLRMFEAFIVADAETVPGINRVEHFSAEREGELVKFTMELSSVLGSVTVNG